METSEKDKTDKAQDCFSCKVISGTVLLLASVHVFTRGAKARMKSTKFTSALFGTSLGYTGFARLFDLFPFNEKPNQKESVANVS